MSIWICTDLHGHYDIYEQINKFILPDDTVEFLGDAVDRGMDSFKLMKAIYNNPRWTYYMGNHEAMLIDALKAYQRTGKTDCLRNYEYYICLRNGAEWGGSTSALTSIIQKNAVEEWIDKLTNLPIFDIKLNNNNYLIHLSHAGTNNPEDTEILNPTRLYWDRKHIYHNLKPKNLDYIVVHGHTPLPCIEGYNFNEPLHFYTPNKLCLDTGIFVTNKAYLVKLDTLAPNHIEYHTFQYEM